MVTSTAGQCLSIWPKAVAQVIAIKVHIIVFVNIHQNLQLHCMTLVVWSLASFSLECKLHRGAQPSPFSCHLKQSPLIQPALAKCPFSEWNLVTYLTVALSLYRILFQYKCEMEWSFQQDIWPKSSIISWKGTWKILWIVLVGAANWRHFTWSWDNW